MRLTFWKWFVGLFLLGGSVQGLWAQEYKYEIGGMAGGAYYMGDLNKNGFFKGLNPSLGAVFRYNVNFRWALKANLQWSQVSGSTDGLENVFPEQALGSFTKQVIDLGAQGEFNFFPYSDKFTYAGAKRFSPYVLLGMGVAVAPGGGGTMASFYLPLGVGAKYKLKPRLNLGCEFSFRKLFSDKLEGDDRFNDPYQVGKSVWKNNDWVSYLLFSVTWDFGPCTSPCNNSKSLSY